MGTVLAKLKEWVEMRVFLRPKVKSSPIILKGFGTGFIKTSLFFLP